LSKKTQDGGFCIITDSNVENLTNQPENTKPKKALAELYPYLDEVIAIAQGKIKIEKKADGDRQAWARIIVSATQAYGKLIEASEIDEVKQRIDALEKTVNKP
jgi:hypothetical protein